MGGGTGATHNHTEQSGREDGNGLRLRPPWNIADSITAEPVKEANGADLQAAQPAYAEIQAMDKAIMERIRQLVIRQSNNSDRQADLTNMRLWRL
jgi:hypothetical protein